MASNEAVKVTAAEFHRNVGAYQDIALTKPVTITKNGRERTVLLSAEEYHRLKRRDRQALRLEDMTTEDMEAISKTEMDPKWNYLNDELKGWKP